MENEKYTSKDIEVLEGLEAVRKRPGMYIGYTDDKGLQKLVFEVVDNSLDEAVAGFCDTVEVIIEKRDGKDVICVKDNGRGIPVDIHEKKGVSALELIMTTLHAGGKFSNSAYKVSGGLHGVGVSVVNALSDWCEAHIFREGFHYYQKYENGLPVTSVEKLEPSLETGSTIIFQPSMEIFEGAKLTNEGIISRLRELAFLNQGLYISFLDKRGKEEKKLGFKFEKGLMSFLQELNKDKEKYPKDPIVIKSQSEKIGFDLVFQYTDSSQDLFFAYANNIRNDEGGVHLNGFRKGLLKILNEMVTFYKLEKEAPNGFVSEDVKEGLTGVLNLKVMNPLFKNQTKDQLTGTEEKDVNIESYIRTEVYESLYRLFEVQKDDARAILNRCILAYKGREAARKARENVKRKSVLESNLGLPGKLADVSEKDPSKCELFIVEGDSAGGSAKQGRNRNFQAILPLRGKLTNVEKMIGDSTRYKTDKILESETILPLIQAIGAGFGETFDLSKIRYHKIIIMADADVDGSHIISLLLTFFYRFMPELIKKGHLYIAMPPLYKLQHGKKRFYVFSDEERDQTISKEFSQIKVDVQRYKGLGEMDPDQLWETTMDPSLRNIMKVTLEDVIAAEEIFTILMGKNTESRREFIQENAKKLDLEELTI
jgi:DNA gyrase subunit B